MILHLKKKVDSERRNLEYLINLYLSQVAVESLAFESSQCAPASSAKASKGKTRLFWSIERRSSINYHSLHSLHDRVNPSTQRNNAIECDVTLELCCTFNKHLTLLIIYVGWQLSADS